MEWKFWAGMSVLYFVLYLGRGVIRVQKREQRELDVACEQRTSTFSQLLLSALRCTAISTAALIGIHIANEE